MQQASVATSPTTATPHPQRTHEARRERHFERAVLGVTNFALLFVPLVASVASHAVVAIADLSRIHVALAQDATTRLASLAHI